MKMTYISRNAYFPILCPLGLYIRPSNPKIDTRDKRVIILVKYETDLMKSYRELAGGERVQNKKQERKDNTNTISLLWFKIIMGYLRRLFSNCFLVHFLYTKQKKKRDDIQLALIISYRK